MDLHFGTIDMTNINRKRGRERELIRRVLKQFKYNKYIEKKSLKMLEKHMGKRFGVRESDLGGE